MNEQELVRYQRSIIDYQKTLIEQWRSTVEYEPEYSDNIPDSDILEYLFGLEIGL